MNWSGRSWGWRLLSFTSHQSNNSSLLSDFFFFFKQKTAYEIVSGDWSSDVCSSDLAELGVVMDDRAQDALADHRMPAHNGEVVLGQRSEERRVGKECLTQCRSRW